MRRPIRSRSGGPRSASCAGPLRRVGASLAALILAVVPTLLFPISIPSASAQGAASVGQAAPQGSHLPIGIPTDAILVKYKATGPRALAECADRLSSRGEAFQSHLADRSDSLDRIRARFKLGREKALFREPTSGTFAGQREALRRRFGQGRAAAASSRNGEAALEDGRPLPELAHVYRVEVPAGVSPELLLAALRADPHVAWAQADHDYVLDQAVAFDDPFLMSAGSWGQPYADLWGPAFVRAPEVWPHAQGEGAVVAVVDTGLDLRHPDIAANVWVNPGEDLDGDAIASESDRNGLDDDQNGFIDDLTGFDFANSVDHDGDGDYDDPGDVSDADPTDDNGHGTHVAGTIAAVANNGLGIVGIAPRARLMPLKGFPAEGSASDAVLWRAVLYAAENGASVVNNSWSCGTPCPVNPLAEEVLEIVEALGLVVVTSAGNASRDVVFYSPENGDRVITVGAVGFDSLLPGFTNRGYLVDLVAPGGGPETPSSVPIARRNILSLRAADTGEDDSPFIVGGDYLRLAGTSMSSPHVAAAVAILRAERPELSPAEVRLLVRLSARELGRPGHDADSGAGALDLVRLLATPLPDLRLELTAPRVGALHDPASGPLVLEGVADGTDLVAHEVEIASGLSGRGFVPLEDFGDSVIPTESSSAPTPSPLAIWNTAAVPDGPYVVRVRAQLRDGRHFDDFTLVGIERNAPLRLSGGSLDAFSPEVTGESLVWQIPENDDPLAPSDLVIGRFPNPEKAMPVPPAAFERPIPLPGDQQFGVRDGALLAWLDRSPEGVRTLQHCRLVADKHCTPQLVTTGPGSIAPPRLRGGWLVWTRTFAGRRLIEGCPLTAQTSASESACVPRPLLDPVTGAEWNLSSFDGRSLILSGAGRIGRCPVPGDGESCVPEVIGLPAGVVSGDPPVHDGDLLVLTRVDVGPVAPPGCDLFEPRPGCAPTFGVYVEHLACSIDPATAFCDPIVLSDRQPVERTAGLVVSGRRIVWAMGDADALPVLRYCEFDAATQRCPTQRIGGVLAAQTDPALDGNRVVWSDGRGGGVAILGLALPDLRGPGTAIAKVGQGFSFSLTAQAGSGGRIRYEIVGLAGIDPAQAGARIVDPGPPGGRITLLARLPETAAGSARWRLRAIGGGGLVSEHTLDLEIRPR